MILDTKEQQDIILAIINLVNIQGSFLDQVYKLKQDVINAEVIELKVQQGGGIAGRLKGVSTP